MSETLTAVELERIRLGLDVIDEQARNGLAFIGGRISRGVIDHRLVKLVEMADKSIALESELAQLRQKTKDQARELRDMNERNRSRNLQLDALHFVWCSGGCPGGAHRWTKETVTAEIVAEAMRNTERLYSWFVNAAGRAPSSVPRNTLWENARAKVLAALSKLKTDELALLRQELERRKAQLGRLYEPLLPLIEREHSKHPHLTLADEAVDAVTALVAAKAEREALARRRDEWMRKRRVGEGILEHQITSDGTHWVKLDIFSETYGTGPTYEAALAAALDKLETTNG